MRRGGLIHNFFVGFLAILASLTFVVTAVAGWTHQTALVTDRFVGVVSSVTTDPQVVDSLGTRVATQVVTRLALEQRLANLLPDQLDRLAVPVTAAVEERIDKAVVNVLTNPQFQSHLTSALARLHSGFLNLVDGNAEFFTVTNGKVTLDLLSVIDAVITQLQTDGVLPTTSDFPRFSEAADRTDFLNRLGTYVDAQLPPDFGQIPIANASSIETIATYLHLVDVSIVVLAVLTLVLGLATILFAHRRLHAVAWLGFTIVVMFGLGILGLAGLQAYASDIVASPDNPVLLGGFVRALAESLTAWLAVIAIAVLLIAIPAWFLARRSGHEPMEGVQTAAAPA
jgi:hypothetical protein